MSHRPTLLILLLVTWSLSPSLWAAAMSGKSDGIFEEVASGEISGALTYFEDLEEDDFESEFISDFELADAPDPELKKFRDPEYLKSEYKRGRMAFLFGQYEIAYKILLPLAENGYSKAQATVGWMYHIGKGKKKDLARALDWYEKAARDNHPVALNNIGVFYEQGLHVGKSPKTAARWYRESAEWGYPYAQYNLGILYHEGRGVKKDPKEAQFWLQIAALQGVSQAVDTLRKISGKVHVGNNKITKAGSKSKDSNTPKWHSTRPENTTSENPHTSSQYKNIADRIKARRSTNDPVDSGFGDSMQPPPTQSKPSSTNKSTNKQKSKPGKNGNSISEKHFNSGEQFDQWLSDAQIAQQQLEKQKLQKKKTNSHTLEIFNDDWVHARNKNYYTIQLAKSDELDSLLKMARKQPMLKETAYYTSLEGGKRWYNLVYGNFRDKKSATAEISNLPKTVKGWSPKVRRFSEVHSNMSLDAPKTLIKKK